MRRLKEFIFEQKCIPWFIREKVLLFDKDVREIHKLAGFNIPLNSFVIYILKLIFDGVFWRHLNSTKLYARSRMPSANIGGWIENENGLLIYAIIRHTRPRVVVETGVGPGGTSAFILKALEDNKHGMLYSIDLPGNDSIVYPSIGKAFHIHVPEGFSIGWLVPSCLRHRWKLIVGDSRKELPVLVNKLKSIDLFLHDSLHTDEHILFEFNTVLPHMNNCGILLCDDVVDYWSRAFEVFCKKFHIKYEIFLNRIGMARIAG